jgi:hypothetical protein
MLFFSSCFCQMESSKPGPSKPKTRTSCSTKLSQLVGHGREFLTSEVPTKRAVICKGLLLREKAAIEGNIARQNYPDSELIKEITPLIIAQWHKANAKFSPPVIVSPRSVARKVENLLRKVKDLTRDRCSQEKSKKILEDLDTLFDITTCSHTIILCDNEDSGCKNPQICPVRAHIHCDCPLAQKIPTLDLEWLYHQRNKKEERSLLMMTGKMHNIFKFSFI